MRTITFTAMAAVLMMAGCENGVGSAFDDGLSERQQTTLIGAGIGALAGQAVGEDTTSTLIGGAVGGGIGYLIGDEEDQEVAQTYDTMQPTALTGTQWRIEDLQMPDEPVYREMYLSFEPDSQLVTTRVLPNGRVVRAVERYRLVDDTLIINRGAAGDQPGYVINADYNVTGDEMTISAQNFDAELERVAQVPAQAQL